MPYAVLHREHHPRADYIQLLKLMMAVTGYSTLGCLPIFSLLDN